MFSHTFEILVCVLLCAHLVSAVGKKSVRKRTTRASQPPFETEQGRSLEDWHQLNREALVLACNAVNLQSSGAREVLANRLYTFHNQGSSLSSASVNSVSSPVVIATDVQPSFTTIQLLMRSEIQRHFLSQNPPVAVTTPDSASNFVPAVTSNIPLLSNFVSTVAPSHDSIPILQQQQGQSAAAAAINYIDTSEILNYQRQLDIINNSSSSAVPVVTSTVHRPLNIQAAAINSPINFLHQSQAVPVAPSTVDSRPSSLNIHAAAGPSNHPSVADYQQQLVQQQALTNQLLDIISRQNININNTTNNSSINLPPLPQAVLKLIEERKFVNFDLLLSSSSPLVLNEYSIQVGAGVDPSVSLVLRSQQSRPEL